MPKGKNSHVGQGDNKLAVAALEPGAGGITLRMGRWVRSQTY